jgi:drug/metabolite transporter (DMT)-like permease
LVLSLLVGEEWSLPRQGETWLALAYLVVLGSVTVFALYIFVLNYWPASRAAYQFVLMPFVTALGGFALLDEPITIGFAVGGAIVLVGIYVGALSATPSPPQAPEQEALALRCSTS